jgi:hypothetical protein
MSNTQTYLQKEKLMKNYTETNEILIQCNECPTEKDMYARDQFTTEEEYQKMKALVPTLFGKANPKLPKHQITKYSFCNYMLCPTHAAAHARDYGKHYKHTYCYMCDQCCWWHVT